MDTHTIPGGRRAIPLSIDRDMALSIDSLLADSLFPPSHVSIGVASLKDGTMLYERDSRYLFTPASNQKLFTTAAVLATLGPYYRIETSVAIDTLSRVVYLKGGGDPTLSPEDLDTLAAWTAASIHDGESWLVAGDASRFDSVYWGNGWMWNDAQDPSGMAVSALSVNGNTIEVRISADSTTGMCPSVVLSPPTAGFPVTNVAVVVDSVLKRLEISRPLMHPGNAIHIDGQIRRKTNDRRVLSVWEPELFTTTLFREALERQKVRCRGTSLAATPEGTQRVTVLSHRMDSVIVYLNKCSDNLSAECLVKLLCHVLQQRTGDWEGGIHEVKRFLFSAGIDTTGIVIADGSGLSRYNLTSAEKIVELLVAVHRLPGVFPTLYTSLPVAGEDGTLGRRMFGTPAEHRLRAKTGTLAGVTSLSGYAPTVGGDTLAFSIIMENLPEGPAKYRQVQDRIGAVLSNFGH